MMMGAAEVEVEVVEVGATMTKAVLQVVEMMGKTVVWVQVLRRVSPWVPWWLWAPWQQVPISCSGGATRGVRQMLVEPEQQQQEQVLLADLTC